VEGGEVNTKWGKGEHNDIRSASHASMLRLNEMEKAIIG
jgi:hypothetical protein